MPGSSNIQTCPKCGALITPQLKKCRMCGHYLHGTSMEGWLMGLMPANLREYPATGILVVLILVTHALLVLLAGTKSIAAFGGFSLIQFGATSGPTLLQGEWWRLVTYMFVHHDLLHLAFNVWCLLYAGRAVEALFDAKKMFLTYLAAGVAGGYVSFLYYVHMRGGAHVMFISGGASGAVCGLVGAALIGARRLGPDGREMFGEMVRWSIYLVIWGFAVPGINNAAHLGGFLAGAGLAFLIPVGLTKSVWHQKVLSVLSLVAMGGVLAAFAWNGYQIQGQPLSLDKDAEPRSLLFFSVSKGEDRDTSSQQVLLERCTRPVARLVQKELKEGGPSKAALVSRFSYDDEFNKKGTFKWKLLQRLDYEDFLALLQNHKVTDDELDQCRVAWKANARFRISFEMLAALLHQRGEREDARRLTETVTRLFKRN